MNFCRKYRFCDSLYWRKIIWLWKSITNFLLPNITSSFFLRIIRFLRFSLSSCCFYFICLKFLTEIALLSFRICFGYQKQIAFLSVSTIWYPFRTNLDLYFCYVFETSIIYIQFIIFLKHQRNNTDNYFSQLCLMDSGFVSDFFLSFSFLNDKSHKTFRLILIENLHRYFPYIFYDSNDLIPRGKYIQDFIIHYLIQHSLATVRWVMLKF